MPFFLTVGFRARLLMFSHYALAAVSTPFAERPGAFPVWIIETSRQGERFCALRAGIACGVIRADAADARQRSG